MNLLHFGRKSANIWSWGRYMRSDRNRTSLKARYLTPVFYFSFRLPATRTAKSTDPSNSRWPVWIRFVRSAPFYTPWRSGVNLRGWSSPLFLLLLPLPLFLSWLTSAHAAFWHRCCSCVGCLTTHGKTPSCGRCLPRRPFLRGPASSRAQRRSLLLLLWPWPQRCRPRRSSLVQWRINLTHRYYLHHQNQTENLSPPFLSSLPPKPYHPSNPQLCCQTVQLPPT